MLRPVSILVVSAVLVAFPMDAQESRPVDPKVTPAVSVPTFMNPTCPIMGKATKADVFVDTDQGRVFLCCKMCVEKVKKDPAAAYAKAYPKLEKLGNTICPVSGEAIKSGEGVAVIYQGREIRVCCADCSKPVRDNGDIVLTLLTNPKVKDLKNTKDPVSDKTVMDNTFVVVGDRLIHLASKDSVDEIKKDPAKYLEKAKASAPKMAEPTEEKHEK